MPVPAGGPPPTTPTVDPTTPIGQVRLLAVDLAEPVLFSDEQITAFLTLEGDSVRLAAALALETTAASEVLVSKKIRTQDLSTDGPAVAKELRERAATLRAQAAVAVDEADRFGIDIIDFEPGGWDCRYERAEPQV